jgi:hypothetical protein
MTRARKRKIHVYLVSLLGSANEEAPNPVKFGSYRVRENVRTQAKKLARTGYSIQEQFPKKIQEERRKLYPVMNEAKRNGQRVSLVKDKLYINGRVHVFGQDPVSETTEG